MEAVFPIILGREGGGEVALLDSFSIRGGAARLSTIAALEAERKLVRELLLSELYSVIRLAGESSERNKLLSMKRDVHNGRALQRYGDLIGKFSPVRNAYLVYLSIDEAISTACDDFKKAFHESLIESIATVGRAFSEFFLHNGILFSSKVMFDEASRVSWPSDLTRKKDRDLVLSVTKYLLRSITKPTPFSSLTSVFALEEQEGDYQRVNFAGKESRVQVTNLIFVRVREILMQSPGFVDCLYVVLNPFVSDTADLDAYQNFFYNRNNDEVIGKIKVDPPVREIIYLLSTPCKLGDFVRMIALRFSEKEQICRAYLLKLIDAGMLRVQYPVGLNNRDWLTTLLDFIAVNNLGAEPGIGEIGDVLDELRIARATLEATKVIAVRSRVFRDCLEKVNSVLNAESKIHYLNELSRSGNLFYEDLFSRNQGDISATKDFGRKLRELHSILNCVTFKSGISESVVSYLRDNNITKVPLLTAYEQCYAKNKASASAVHTNLEELDTLVKKVLEVLKEANAPHSLRLEDFTDLSGGFPRAGQKFGAFVQVTAGEHHMLVLNSFSQGWGSNIARYLDYFPPDYTGRIHSYFSGERHGGILADVRDASIHNAGTFPILTQYAIDIAGVCSGSDTEFIPLDSLFIQLDSTQKPGLFTEKGIRVIPVNFSMEAVHRKSGLVQFLSFFNDVDLFGSGYFFQTIQSSLIRLATLRGVFTSPRITYKESIVLKRRQWHLSTLVLRKEIGEYAGSADDFCIRLHRFLTAYSIPAQIFVKNYSLSESSLREGHKPQYIDFLSPLCILLFMNLLSKSDILEFSEVLPELGTADENASPKVREFVLNL